MVQETKDRHGPCDWKPAPKGTLETVVENAFCELENDYELASVKELGWKEWTDSEKLWVQDEEGDTVIDTNKEAFAKAVADTEASAREAADDAAARPAAAVEPAEQ